MWVFLMTEKLNILRLIIQENPSGGSNIIRGGRNKDGYTG
jgi:hypothetical protein